ncbi:hypothetical protein [Paraliomyxa miuraensis]|uniref:hypothetical protein n=1 Tax=Paraliomyxa miuraensis TaxID=376150 RepID=UPI002257A532|nr:hypothetical protein [Paraliomyxa miuraensis]MCX4241086.1 hypothetical protein [Paraliomyxa miuraensis]
MLEYFGFYDSPSTPCSEPELQEQAHAQVVERASRLADRARHSQPLHNAGRVWEPVGTLKR